MAAHAASMPGANSRNPRIIRTCEPLSCCDDVWEEAYLRFETPGEEIEKFVRRLQRAGATNWDPQSRIVEIFCGRGNGLKALRQLGFRHLEGADLSERLLREYDGDETLYVADCRTLPFDDRSRDVIVVQGGLHHLPEVESNLSAVLSESCRVLRQGGLFVMVEPWLTPFLQAVHLVAAQPVVRRFAPRIDAFATMTEREAETYFHWLGLSDFILARLHEHFETVSLRIAWGKIAFVGRPRNVQASPAAFRRNVAAA
jgi:SAM-dependent methyltransferase